MRSAAYWRESGIDRESPRQSPCIGRNWLCLSVFFLNHRLHRGAVLAIKSTPRGFEVLSTVLTISSAGLVWWLCFVENLADAAVDS